MVKPGTIQNARTRDPDGKERLVAVEMEAGRIIAIVPQDDAPAPQGDILDADGAWLSPGFVDAHVHFVMSGLALQQLDLTGVTSREEFEHRITQEHARLPREAWLLADGWLEGDWRGDVPEKSWLAAAGDRPAACWKKDHHAVLVNEPVLAMLGAHGLDSPPGGEIVRNQDGSSTGLMLEAAAWELVIPLIPTPSVPVRQEASRAAARALAAYGVVAVGAMEYAEEVINILEPIRDDLAVRIMVTMLDRELPIDEPLARLQAMRSDDRLGLIGCKAFLDGTFGSRTAAMLEPWSDGPANNLGMLVELAERGEVHQWMERVVEAGLSPSMHAIGDRAARLALDAADHADQHASERGLPRPWVRIEHCQAVHPDDVPRFAGRVASMQPLHVLDDGRAAHDRLGAERMPRFFPFRPLQDADAILAFGSDWPIAEPDVMAGIRAAVHGLDRNGRQTLDDRAVDVATALEAYTHDARRALQLPAVTPEAGDPADLVLLDRCPLASDYVEELPRVLTTLMNGHISYDARTMETPA
ncbi:MAG: amidohydrolase family protein [Phycisphaerales bacterium]|nr:amidohydrolase family protein [Phycisphaerales bacterium]